MGFTISQTSEEVKAAHRFQVNAELGDLQLLDCSATSSEGKARGQEQLRLGLKMESAVLDVTDEKVTFSMRISIFGDTLGTASKDVGHVLEVTCRYAVTYLLRPGYKPAPAELDAFKDGNVIFHCWPYTRELIQNLTMRMGLPIPPVPFLRLAPKAEPKKRASSKRQAKAETTAPTGESES